MRNQDITIYGDGSQTRSSCRVDDLIDGMLRFTDTGKDFTGPVNLGNPAEFTVLELAEKVLELTASRGRLAFKALPQDDPKQRKPDIALAPQVLDWRPTVSLDDGLARTVDYFKSTLSLR